MVKYIIDIVSSKRDINGNTYHAVTYKRVSDGATLSGTIDSASNAGHYLHKVGAIEFGKNQTHCTSATVSIREFNRFTKGMKYITVELVKEWSAK